MSAPPPGRWCTFPSPYLSARTRLFCFPYAGGGASAYFSWADDLRRRGVELCALQPPGREARLAERPHVRLEVLVEEITAAVKPLLRGRVCFFGHSFGALVAFEVARLLRRRGLPTPAYLCVSGARPPDTPRHHPEPLRLLSDAEFMQAVSARYGGIPSAVLAQQELVDIVLPALRADLTMFETYVYHHEPPLECPIAAFAGRDDRNVDDSMLARWEAHTRGRFTMTRFPGGHFFLQQERAALLAAMTPALAGP
jgi:surfactin synthase thioesterase subunit